jgi:hypothetical protein
MIRPGSAIKRKQKPLPQAIAQKQVMISESHYNYNLVRGK